MPLVATSAASALRFCSICSAQSQLFRDLGVGIVAAPRYSSSSSSSSINA